MNYQVELTQVAQAETDEAYLWICERAPAAAARWYNGLLAAVDSLKTDPERYALAPEAETFIRWPSNTSSPSKT